MGTNTKTDIRIFVLLIRVYSNMCFSNQKLISDWNTGNFSFPEHFLHSLFFSTDIFEFKFEVNQEKKSPPYINRISSSQFNRVLEENKMADNSISLLM